MIGTAFRQAKKFNSDVSKWAVSRVIDMSYTFEGASKFNSDVSKWVVSGVTNMYDMFARASLFNSDLSKWAVSRVTNMAFSAYLLKFCLYRLFSFHLHVIYYC